MIDVVVCGLDVDNFDVVFNYDLFCDFEVYVYCIGCIGCVGSKGLVFSFFSDNESYCVV